MSHNLPYVLRVGTLTKILEKAKAAAVPERFTQDFLETKLGFKGGSAKAVIPLLKKIGLLASDGSPTDLYRRFRNPAMSGAAMAAAIKHGYKTLYEMNEYVHDATDKDLKGLVVQATGAESDSRVVQAIVASFKALKALAKFDQDLGDEEPQEKGASRSEEVTDDSQKGAAFTRRERSNGFNLAYTINLNLPASTDIAVFDAIFKSLKEHLLKS
jgi:hypothetical protein